MTADTHRLPGRLAAAAFAIPAAVVAPAARADDARGGAGFILFMVGQLVPGEIGVDRAIASNPDARLRLGWVDQIPLGIFAGQGDEASPLWEHRIVIRGTLSFGFERLHAERRFRLAGGDVCGGYRYRFREWNGVAPYLGLGVGGDGSPFLSPEVGLHFGRDGVLRPGVQLGLEGKAYFDGSPTRIQGVAAWTIW